MADSLEPFRLALADRYTIGRKLAAGACATVYLARDLKHDREVAFKVLRPDVSVLRDRFSREITLVAALRHPHILPLHDSGEAAGLLFYVMPYVQGETLMAHIQRAGPMDLVEALRYAGEIADALDYAHRHGVVHRDVKPENILLEERHAVVADFGFAFTASPTDQGKITRTGYAIGTPIYMSPEQITTGAVDGRSDIYSLGCVLHEMIAGSRPFHGRNVREVMTKRLTTTPPALSTLRAGIPSGLDAALERAVAIEPDDRFNSAAEFRDALAAVARGIPPGLDAVAPHEVPATRPKSIVVLPFVNMSADPENEYFSDGVTEDVINALTKISGLRVAARTSAFAFKGKDQDVREIGRQLNVTTVLEGSVRRATNRLRISAQLINAADGYHLWSEQYDRDPDDVFVVQDEISRSIVETLKGKLGLAGEGRALVKPQTRNMEAYELYLKGRFFWNQRGEGLLRARDLFEQVIAMDPEYAQAHAGLGDTYNLLGWYRAVPPEEAFPKARAAAERAIELDDTLAEAYTSLAFEKMCYEWAWRDAERAFVRSLELNPGYATTHHWYAEFLITQGRLVEAIDAAERAAQLDPLGLIIKIVVAMANYFAGNYERCVDICNQTLDMDPAFTPALHWLGLAHLQLGEHDCAIEVFAKEHDLAPERPTTLAFLGVAHARRGDRAEAEEARVALVAPDTGYVSPFDRGLLELHLGNRDGALDAFEQAYEERSVWLAWAGVDPMLDSLREEQRFQEILRKMGVG